MIKNGIKPYLITIFSLSAALVYGPFAREWLMFRGIDEEHSSGWASLAGLVTFVAGLWLLSRFFATKEEEEEKGRSLKERRYRKWLNARYVGIDTDKLKLSHYHQRQERWRRQGFSLDGVPDNWDPAEGLEEIAGYTIYPGDTAARKENL